MRRHMEQHTSLARGFAHQVKLVLLEVAQAAVNQPRRMRRRAAREVALLHHGRAKAAQRRIARDPRAGDPARSEEHTSELQSRENLVCRLLLEKKKAIITATTTFLPKAITVLHPSTECLI